MNNRDHGQTKMRWIGLVASIYLALILAGCAAQEASVQTPSEPAPPPAVEEPKPAEPPAARPGFTAPQVQQQQQAAVQRERREQAAAAAPAPEPMVPPDLNADVLPPPRPLQDTGPDLFKAEFRLSAGNLGSAASDVIPDDVREKLAVLEDQTFSNATELVAALRGGVGYNLTQDTLEKVLRNTLEISLDDQPTAPAGNVDLVAAEERQKEVAMTTKQPEAMATEFGIVYFDFDRSNIKPEFVETIRANAKKLIDNPNMMVVVEGHCDERGTTEYNLALGQRRASAVFDALIAEGVAASQLSTISYGEERPLAMGHDEAAWSQNRRSVITIK
jgi:peptidoglycan-associated lipoprotein